MATAETTASPGRLSDATAETVARRLAAIAEPTRLKLLAELSNGESASVQELAETVGGSLTNISRHLHVLHNAGLIVRRKEGTFVHYRLTRQTVGMFTQYAVRMFGGRSQR